MMLFNMYTGCIKHNVTTVDTCITIHAQFTFYGSTVVNLVAML